jgi:predicted nuclease of restriction endonuclease-like RecB superfamily
VRFSLQDVKKQVQRKEGDLCVSLHFLRPGELYNEIERLVAFHERHLGLQHRLFSIDDARACVADYRLANCLMATLSAWYVWRQPDWKEVLLRSGNDLLLRLEEAGITSPIYLRLALFNYVNEHYSGFLDGQRRTEALQAFATCHGLSVPDLEYLLALDSEAEAVLVRETPHQPDAREVAALYNQWVFEAALFSASNVHFVIDCNAFLQMQHAENLSHSPVAGMGAVIKRLCYLARKLGVYYDLSYDNGQIDVFSPGTMAPAHSSGITAPILHLTLYGPQEMTGAPQQYGLRLARLCRMILGYGSPRPVGADQSAVGAKDINALRSAPLRPLQRGRLIGAVREAEATVHFLQRSYRFIMNADLLKLLPSDAALSTTTPAATLPVGTSAERSEARLNPSAPAVIDRPSHLNSSSSSIFDSSIEQSFSEAFVALANSQGADGWQLEREPEPLLLNSTSGETNAQSIFIPDFALTRGTRRIYVEILGFWTPSYRERKIARLQQLKGRDDLVLAIPQEAHAAFAAIAQDFPIVEYDGQLSATELLQLLRSRYDDFEERLAQIDADSIRERIIKEGLLPERTCYELLHSYRRSELQRAAQDIVTETITFTPGIGLYAIDWLEHLRVSFVEWLESAISEVPGNTLPLQEVLRNTRFQWPVLAQCEDSAIEALISLWPQVRVSRSSIFEATIGLMNDPGEQGGDTQLNALPAYETTVITSQPAAKRQIRERRAIYKKRGADETIQGDLWG